MNSLTVDIQGAADLMKVHPKTVQDKIASGELRAARVGRAYVLMVRDVMDYIERTIMEQTAARMGAPEKRERKSRRADLSPIL